MLIIGLGNPGEEYQNTRHNVGFLVLDSVAKNLGLKFSEKKNLESEIIETNIEGEKIILAKPTTFMNNSGRAVQKLATEYKIQKEEIIVIHDDVHQELGRVRLRNDGTPGGNNGIKSVIEHVGKNFWRVKVGAGITPENIPLKKWVLSKFRSDERDILEKTVNTVGEYLLNHKASELKETTINLN